MNTREEKVFAVNLASEMLTKANKEINELKDKIRRRNLQIKELKNIINVDKELSQNLKNKVEDVLFYIDRYSNDYQLEEIKRILTA